MKLFFKPIHLLTMVSIWISICCASMLEWDSTGNLIAHSYSIWGDWSAHFTFISNLLERGPSFLWGDNPVFAGIPFQYPFLSHVFTALVAFVTRTSPITATYRTSLILMFTLPFCLDYFFRGLKLKPWTSAIATLLFLLMGGFQFLSSTLSATEPYTNQFSQGSVFTQFIAFEFFPQRAFLFGLIVFSLVSGKLLRRLDGRQINLKFLIFTGLAISFTAWLHLHTWIAFAIVLLAYFVFPPKPELRKNAFFFGASIAAFSGVLLAFLLLRNQASDTRISWDLWFPGWAQNSKAGLAGASDMNPISFWIFNTGFFLPLALSGFWQARQNQNLRFLFAAGAFIFVLANLINIQPYYYDNLKLFTYSFLFLSPFAALSIEAIASKKFLIPVAILLTAIQCYSGFHDLEFLRTEHQTASFFSAHEIRLANQFKLLRHSANDLVLINPRHNHWASCLTGNPVVMGYAGWLWSWGINYGEREREVKAILTGAPDLQERIKKLNIAYIVVNTNERIQEQPMQTAPLRALYPLLLSEAGWEVYSTKSPSSSVR